MIIWFAFLSLAMLCVCIVLTFVSAITGTYMIGAVSTGGIAFFAVWGIILFMVAE